MKFYVNMLSEEMLSTLKARGFNAAMFVAAHPTELGPDEFALEVFEGNLSDEQVLESLENLAYPEKTVVLLLQRRSWTRGLTRAINDRHPNVTVLVGYDELAAWVVDQRTRSERSE